MSILTTREKEIFYLLVNGYSSYEIGCKLGISEKTVCNHISNVIQKLDVNNRVAAVVELIKLKEINLTY